MSFRWSDYLVLAEELCNRNDEASLRAGISRAYYAVFCEAKLRAEIEQGHAFTGESVHLLVSTYFERSSLGSRIAFGSILKNLKGQRVKVDYDTNFVCTSKHAQQAISDARFLMTELITMFP